MAANVVYDVIWSAKQRFEQHIRESKAVDLVLAAEAAAEFDKTWDDLFDLPQGELNPSDWLLPNRSI